jgi:hypothetical protein
LSSSERKPSADRRARLSYADIKPVLARLGDLTEDIVLVGGQAVSFWVDVYSGRDSALARLVPLASKDIDFCGDVRAVRICAERLAGRPRLPSMDDHTPNTGVVTFVDARGVERTIDFIDQPHGLRAKDVYRTALPIRVLDHAGKPTEVSFRVMHPLHVMESRVHNCVGLPGYRTDHALKQLRASVVCAREFIRDMLGSDRARVALKLNERIFAFCLDDRDGREVHSKFGVDPFEAVVADDDHLPARFRETRYPQMQRELGARRGRRRR